jgi:hypothetical protein
MLKSVKTPLSDKNAAFSQGLYTIKNCNLHISGKGVNVTANDAASLLAGRGASVTINTTGTITVTPAAALAAGQFEGFIFSCVSGADQRNVGFTVLERRACERLLCRLPPVAWRGAAVELH